MARYGFPLMPDDPESVAQELAAGESPQEVAERISTRRLAMNEYPDNTPIVRESRDHGW